MESCSNQNVLFLYKFYCKLLEETTQSKLKKFKESTSKFKQSDHLLRQISSILLETSKKLAIVDNQLPKTEFFLDPTVSTEHLKEQLFGKLVYKDRLMYAAHRENFKALSNIKLRADIQTIHNVIKSYCDSDVPTVSMALIQYNLIGMNEIMNIHRLLTEYRHQRTQNTQLMEKNKLMLEKRIKCNDTDETSNELESSMEWCKITSHAVNDFNQKHRDEVERRLNDEIQEVEKRIEISKKATDVELVTIGHLKSFHQEKCANLQKQIENLSRKYDIQKKQLDDQVLVTKSKIEDVHSKYVVIFNWYNEQAAFIKEYRAEQAMREEIRRMENTKRLAAIFIQAWWRGMMVRNQLGPYKPKKGKDDGKHKKKKSKHN